MSYAKATDSLLGRVVGLTPAWEPDRPFYTLEAGDGGHLELEQAPDDVVRLCDLRMRSLPVDDNQSGYGLARFRVELELRVRYPAAIDRARTERMMASDVAQLANALIHPALPTPWHGSIETVEPPGPASLAPIRGAKGTTTVAHLVRLPFALHYTVDLEA